MNDELYTAIDTKDYNIIDKAYNKLLHYLIDGETVFYIVVQSKIGITNDFIAITSQRLIIYSPKQLGLSSDIITINWLHVERCSIKEGLLKSQFSVYENIDSMLYTVDSLPKVATRKLHAMCENLMQKHYELDQKRKSQQINLNIPNHSVNNDDSMKLLQDIKKLYDSKLITLDDYNRKKEEILNRM